MSSRMVFEVLNRCARSLVHFDILVSGICLVKPDWFSYAASLKYLQALEAMVRSFGARWREQHSHFEGIHVRPTGHPAPTAWGSPVGRCSLLQAPCYLKIHSENCCCLCEQTFKLLHHWIAKLRLHGQVGFSSAVEHTDGISQFSVIHVTHRKFKNIHYGCKMVEKYKIAPMKKNENQLRPATGHQRQRNCSPFLPSGHSSNGHPCVVDSASAVSFLWSEPRSCKI